MRLKAKGEECEVREGLWDNKYDVRSSGVASDRSGRPTLHGVWNEACPKNPLGSIRFSHSPIIRRMTRAFSRSLTNLSPLFHGHPLCSEGKGAKKRAQPDLKLNRN